MVDQALKPSASGSNGNVQAETCTPSAVVCHYEKPLGSVVDSCLDTMMITNVFASLSYRGIHSVFKAFGIVLHIRLKYDDDCLSNRCYVTFTSDAAKPGHEAMFPASW